ncbi:1-deoxy-D-xylulose-5-phosphate reductoisomerase [Candidatus Curtissbacteria bacterium RIFCSPLOWO2_01_FULL_41_18]|uniref:1-deoxy-D-xylulose 5-phosphate reductoisomerase n=2 Tax=Candidatus Curtissiibacteriota TaxID=1752717 RepID=A0A1F5G0N6_9BACT|nr:MAG: 1-deoxy-D-xylulose-5-phosphate reductoisomerase [Candidatus Curtissbacteria bacterium RIFCSPHIGHO2_01_FULL_41_13]OGE03832.1 MAG: 1-deoxy-D-xylulose-5-phosphate reductoisomerase [Candidatus Curtissbacteria bacterium RIFCSPLOWO2_01_FULL_41_18]
MPVPINISILGSTGSIGTQTLAVVDQFKSQLKVVGLAAGGNVDLLTKQIRKYHPKVVSVKKEEDAKKIDVLWGDKGNCAVATIPVVDKVVIATPGLAGIKPTLAAIRKKKTIALATKEVLVAAGSLVTSEAAKHKIKILPIDSEHSAIFQCLESRTTEEVKRVILTASGGPFRGMKPNQLKNIRPEQALKHPNWKMGAKITIDSATLMNKGFEVCEAMWLFGVPLEKIRVIVHPQSIIHSAVEFIDGSIIAQMGPSDMRLPIQFALLYPGKRQENNFRRFSFGDYPSLSFEEPDIKTFRCLGLAFQAISVGKTATAVLTAANDIAVGAFLSGRLSFLRIPDVVESTLSAHTPKSFSELNEILEVDTWARSKAHEFVVKFGN